MKFPRVIKDWAIALGLALIVYSVAARFMMKPPDLPDQAPEFHVTDVDQNPLDLEAFAGQTVVLNFWASWCGPCRAEAPEFSKFAKAHPDIAVVGLAVDSGSAAAVRKSAEKLGMDYTIAMANSATTQAYKVEVLPTTIIIGPNGEVISSHVGLMSLRQLEAAALLDS